MKQKWIFSLLAAALVLLNPAALLAADEVYDARMTGFYNGPNAVQSVHLPVSTSVTWIIMLVLMAVAAGVMFKNAKRTHLD
jgi:hypothetical protein